MSIRDNWRILLLIVLVAASAVVLFVPGAPPGANPDDFNGTNIQYGIQLDGGSRIQAPVVGTTAEGVNVTVNASNDLEVALSNQFGIDQIDVQVSAGTQTVEVFTRNVSQSELRTALESRGYSVSGVRNGVTAETRQDVVEVVRQRISDSALSGGTVTTIQTPGGTNFISVEAPDRGLDELQALLDQRGVVRVWAYYPGENDSYQRQQILDQEELVDIGNARNTDRYGPAVSATVSQAAVGRFQDDLTALGFDGATQCDYNYENPMNASGRCLTVTLNEEVVYMRGVSQDLGSSFGDGSFADDPTFVMPVGSMEEARNLEVNLKSGRLPAPLDFENDRRTELQPALAEQFRSNSVIVGIAAVIAVSLVVYFRYGNPRVAAPMVVTALSEVFLLLGFVSFVQYPLNLSHIAGFIAVIGTGVDDLIIIADEILQQGDVATGRVFQNRFRKAFWVIGAAAATTIVAMSPLTVLALGDLTGFAIVTIVGVLLGVLVTRPAYGDVLRNLMLSDSND